MIPMTDLTKQTLELVKTRDNWELDTRHGNCPKCGKQYREAKDTKTSWFLIGIMAGQNDMLNHIREGMD